MCFLPRALSCLGAVEIHTPVCIADLQKAKRFIRDRKQSWLPWAGGAGGKWG